MRAYIHNVLILFKWAHAHNPELSVIASTNLIRYSDNKLCGGWAMLEKVSWYGGWIATVVGGVMTAYPALFPQQIGLVIALLGIALILIKARGVVFMLIQKVRLWLSYCFSEPWPHFKRWDNADKFELYEAACLWCDKEPKLRMPRSAKRIHDRFVSDIRQNRLKLYYTSTKEAVAAAVELHMPEWSDESPFNVHSKVQRAELVRYATEMRVRPVFLFKDGRGA
jgi:hypothetical protein